MKSLTSIDDSSAFINLDPLPDGKRQITVLPKNASTYIHRKKFITSYDDRTINAILAAKGPSFLCDEIARDEDPFYIRPHIILTVSSHIDPADLAGKRIMDFGCGCGASTIALSQLLPESRIMGIDLVASNLEVARARADFYQLDNLSFTLSPDSDRLPDDCGMFDAIMLPAVYEHLLPAERSALLSTLWSRLNPGGILFIDETPWRWFPIETHTTGLVFINYLPDSLALWYSRTFSRRVDKGMSWPVLLRRGIRGGTISEIIDNIGSAAVLLKPAREGITNYVDLWDRGYAASNPARKNLARSMAVTILSMTERLTGLAIVPYLSIAIRKPG